MDRQPALLRESSAAATVEVERAALPGVAADVAANRWMQLALGVAAMVTIAGPQYVWTLFTGPLTRALGTNLAQLQVTFSVLIVVQTFLSPAQGALIERFGPRVLLSIGTLVTGVSWVLASQASSVWGLYLTYGLLGGIGTGIVYIGVVGHMVRWFPDRRGLATGFVAAGYGMGALLFTFPVAESIRTAGHSATMLQFGAMFGLSGFLVAQGFRRPPVARPAGPRTVPTAGPAASSRDFTPRQMLRTPIFWLLFVMMTMMSTSGLMVTSQMGAFTADFGMANVLVLGMPLLPLALSLDRVTNGATRPFFGWVSDRLGREPAMFIAFSLEAAAMTVWLLTRDNPVLFVLMSGVVFFGWGEIFSLFPSTLTDTYGTRHATSNYGCLYMAQGIGSVLGGPMAALLHERTGSWIPVFALIIVMDAATAVLAIAVLRPMRARWFTRLAVPSAGA